MSRSVLFLVNGLGYYGDYDNYGDAGYSDGPTPGNSGLYLSAQYVVDMLNASGVPARLVAVRGLDGIDEVISEVSPSDVVIEALFVAPSELQYLVNKYPNIRWFVRSHSQLPFLAQDGLATEWVWAYLQLPAVNVAANTLRGTNDLKIIVHG